MRGMIALLVAVAAPSIAAAQPQSGGDAGFTPSAQSGMAVTSRLNGSEPYSEYECLVRKSDQKRMCKTREEWRVVAARMAAADKRDR